jgi:hypothetical protein
MVGISSSPGATTDDAFPRPAELHWRRTQTHSYDAPNPPRRDPMRTGEHSVTAEGGLTRVSDAKMPDHGAVRIRGGAPTTASN